MNEKYLNKLIIKKFDLIKLLIINKNLTQEKSLEIRDELRRVNNLISEIKGDKKDIIVKTK